MLDIQVSIDGVPVQLRTRADLRMFTRFIETYLRLTSQADVEETAVFETRPRRSVVVPTKESVEQDIATKSEGAQFSLKSPPTGERMEDYMIKALMVRPTGLTPVQLMDVMRHMGWTTSSQDPLKLVQVRLYENKELFSRTEDGGWKLSDKYNESKDKSLLTKDENKPGHRVQD